MTITTPGPVLLDDERRARCRRRPCTVAPKIGEFGDFAAAVAKRYAGRVDYYSIGNEFNLGKNWLTPRFKRSGRTKYDFGAAVYRKMWIAGHRAIARFDPSRRNRVLFAETAAVASPVPFIRNALCIDDKGRALRGKLRAAPGLQRQGRQAQHRRHGRPPLQLRRQRHAAAARAQEDHAHDGAHAAPAQADEPGGPPQAHSGRREASSSPSSASRPSRRTGSRTSRSPSRRSTSTSPTGSSTATGGSRR